MKNKDIYITPDEYKEAARNGIPKHILDVRIRRLGWPRRKALIMPVQKKSSRKLDA